MANDNENSPILSDVPPKIDNGYVRKTLSEIKRAQAKQATIEAERSGASKLTTRLVTLFGTVMTAAVVGGFVWVLDVQSQNQAQDTAIQYLNDGSLRSHGHRDIENTHSEGMRRVDAIETWQKNLGERLDRRDKAMAKKFDEIIKEIRRRRTWGN